MTSREPIQMKRKVRRDHWDRKVRKTIIALRKPVQMDKSAGRGRWKRRDKGNDKDFERTDPNEEKSEKGSLWETRRTLRR